MSEEIPEARRVQREAALLRRPGTKMECRADYFEQSGGGDEHLSVASFPGRKPANGYYFCVFSQDGDGNNLQQDTDGGAYWEYPVEFRGIEPSSSGMRSREWTHVQVSRVFEGD